jgi:hypothetical protein
METLESGSFAAAIAFSAAFVFLLSLIPVCLAASLIGKLKQHGKLRTAKTGEGLTGFDLLLFDFQQKASQGYYVLFVQILFCYLMAGIGPWLYRATATEYQEVASGDHSYSSLGRFSRTIYDMYGAEQGAAATAVLIALAVFFGMFTFVINCRRIRRGEPVE